MEVPLSALVNTTLAPGTTPPEASRTVPLTEALFCAQAAEARTMNKAKQFKTRCICLSPNQQGANNNIPNRNRRQALNGLNRRNASGGVVSYRQRRAVH